MKRTYWILLLLVALIGSFFYIYPKTSFFSKQQKQQSVQQQSLVKVTIDSGKDVATVSAVPAANAFEALMRAAAKEDMQVKTKQYDFGVFVEQVGSLANTKDFSWIYFVNGKAGTVAADKQAVANGDSVEWKYVPPTNE